MGPLPSKSSVWGGWHSRHRKALHSCSHPRLAPGWQTACRWQWQGLVHPPENPKSSATAFPTPLVVPVKGKQEHPPKAYQNLTHRDFLVCALLLSCHLKQGEKVSSANLGLRKGSCHVNRTKATPRLWCDVKQLKWLSLGHLPQEGRSQVIPDTSVASNSPFAKAHPFLHNDTPSQYKSRRKKLSCPGLWVLRF